MQLSEHFTLAEMTASQTATRKGLKNEPNATALENLKALCINVLEPFREAVNAPITVSSGYRSVPVNAAIGGVSTSRHCKGEAVDCEVVGMSITEAVKKLKSLNLPVDQVIHEGSWLHISHKRLGSNRNQWLKATFTKKGVNYSPLEF